MVDLTIEKMVLSAMVTHSLRCSMGMEALKEEHFTVYKEIYRVVKKLWDRDGDVSLVSFASEYRGDLISIAEITQNSLYFNVNSEFEFAIQRLRKLEKCRRVARGAEQALNLATDGELEEALSVGSEVFGAVGMDENIRSTRTPKEHADQIFEIMLESPDERKEGLFTPFPTLNFYVNGGLSAGDLIILAAPTGHGKTALSLNMAVGFAMEQKAPTLYINTEMSDRQIDNRLIAILCNDKRITYSKLESGKLSEDERKVIQIALDRMYESEFYSITIPDLDIQKTEATIRKFKAKHGLKVAIVDYVGRMDTQDPKKPKHEVLELIAKRLKTLAQMEDVLIVMVAQLTKSGTLQGSQAMENEATVYTILDRPKGESKEDKARMKWLQERGGNSRMVISKNRIGREGYLILYFKGDQLIFEEVEQPK